MKFDSNTQGGKLQFTIWKQRNEVFKSINSIFSTTYQDFDLFCINTLSILTLFPILTLNQLRVLSFFHYKILTKLYYLEKIQLIKLYRKNHQEYQEKKLLLPNFIEKGMIIEALEDIKNLIENNAVYEIDKFNKIALAQLKRKSNTPYRIPDTAILVELTNKGRILLKKLIAIYEYSFSISIKKSLSIWECSVYR